MLSAPLSLGDIRLLAIVIFLIFMLSLAPHCCLTLFSWLFWMVVHVLVNVIAQINIIISLYMIPVTFVKWKPKLVFTVIYRRLYFVCYLLPGFHLFLWRRGVLAESQRRSQADVLHGKDPSIFQLVSFFSFQPRWIIPSYPGLCFVGLLGFTLTDVKNEQKHLKD